MGYPTLSHPSRYVWDFWYWYDAAAGIFHVFYLNAPLELAALGQHHGAATVGYGTTVDFTHMQWGPVDVLAADADGWDNTSIWTGDVLPVKSGFLMLYTSRDRNWDDGYTQAVGMAVAPRIDGRFWQRRPGRPLRVSGDYEPRGLPDDLSVHAWRDPFVFGWAGSTYMLLSAKVRGQAQGSNGAVAWLRALDGLTVWQPLPPLAAPGCFSEMEVPQLYRRSDGRLELLFSSTAALDFHPQTPHHGGLYSIVADQLEDFARRSPRSCLPASSGLYACRAIPELEGELVGFDLKTGGLRRSGLKTYLQSVDRDFSDCML